VIAARRAGTDVNRRIHSGTSLPLKNRAKKICAPSTRIVDRSTRQPLS
jgi:hypothetical protein